MRRKREGNEKGNEKEINKHTGNATRQPRAMARTQNTSACIGRTCPWRSTPPPARQSAGASCRAPAPSPPAAPRPSPAAPGRGEPHARTPSRQRTRWMTMASRSSSKSKPSFRSTAPAMPISAFATAAICSCNWSERRGPRHSANTWQRSSSATEAARRVFSSSRSACAQSDTHTRRSVPAGWPSQPRGGPGGRPAGPAAGRRWHYTHEYLAPPFAGPHASE